MTFSPRCDVVEGSGTLTSVPASLQYYDGRVRDLVETRVDGRLSLLNHATETNSQFKQGQLVFRFSGYSFLKDPVLPTNQAKYQIVTMDSSLV
jgi:hypothetical protein